MIALWRLLNRVLDSWHSLRMRSPEPEAMCAPPSEISACTVHTIELGSPDGFDAQQRDDDEQLEGSLDEQAEQEGAPNAAPQQMVRCAHCPQLCGILAVPDVRHEDLQAVRVLV